MSNKSFPQQDHGRTGRKLEVEDMTTQYYLNRITNILEVMLEQLSSITGIEVDEDDLNKDNQE